MIFESVNADLALSYNLASRFKLDLQLTKSNEKRHTAELHFINTLHNSRAPFHMKRVKIKQIAGILDKVTKKLT